MRKLIIGVVLVIAAGAGLAPPGSARADPPGDPPLSAHPSGHAGAPATGGRGGNDAGRPEERETDGEIAQLIDRTENQVAEGRVWTPPGDNALETVRHILELIPTATPETIRHVNAIPARLRERAAIEDAAGRSVEARRFAIFAEALGPLAGDKPLTTRQAASQPGRRAAGSRPAAAPADLPAPASVPAPVPTASPDVAPAASSAAMPTSAAKPTATAAADPVDPPQMSRAPVPAPAEQSTAVATLAGAPPQPPASARTASADALPPETITALVRRGNAMLAVGDISAARLLFERAAQAGHAAAATAVGRTYDPAALAQIGARGIRADPELAATWYRRAVALGDPEATQRLQRLEATGTR
jgi:hypothetical protein